MQELWMVRLLCSKGFSTCPTAGFPVGRAGLLCLPLFLFLGPAPAPAEGLAPLVQQRTAIERVYYNHRLGQKPPFEQVSPPSLIERLVKEDMRKEAALKQAFGVEITPTSIEAEVHRINSTTRAPEMLAEIKAALGNDTVKFASAFVRPILVEQLLRDKFENDDTLHATQRREAERVREQLLVARGSRGNTNKSVENLVSMLGAGHSNAVTETTWQLGHRPAETNTPSGEELEIKQRFGPSAEIISSPQRDKDRKFYFADLPTELQRVLRAQLRQPGDVSAVIETSDGFLLYVAKEKTDTAFTTDCLSVPKRNYEQWLSEQNGGTK
jgi:hypothetical protein